MRSAIFNGDGIPDVALTDNVGVELLFHTGAVGTTTYAAPVTIYPQLAPAAFYGANLIAIADVNGDGLNDLIITDPGPPGGSAPIGGGAAAGCGESRPVPGTGELSPTAMGSLARSIIVTDVNGDGFPDIVIGGDNAVTVLLQNPAAKGTFLPATNYAVSNANQIAIADVNGDGLVDIVIGTGPTQPTVNGVITNHPGVLLQNATAPGTFGAVQDFPP